MGRPQLFTRQQVLDAAVSLVAAGGPPAASMAAVAEEMGGPTGSIYHRFGSREELLGEMWIGIAESFQHPFVDILASAGSAVEVGVEAALHTPRWARENLAQARIFLLYRREDVLPKGWPGNVEERAERLRSELRDAMGSYVQRLAGAASAVAVERCAFSIVDIPYAGVRRYLAAGKAPSSLAEQLIEECARAVLTEVATSV